MIKYELLTSIACQVPVKFVQCLRSHSRPLVFLVSEFVVMTSDYLPFQWKATLIAVVMYAKFEALTAVVSQARVLF